MPGKRHSPRYGPRAQDVPVKPDLDIPFPSDIGENLTQAPGTEIAPPQMGRLDTGTSSYFLEDETTDTPKIYAPVNLPDRSSLVIDLVKADLVYQLEEYRSDESKMAGAFWAFVGAIISLIINWVTSSPITITTVSIVFMVFFILLGGLSALFMFTLKRRASKKSEEIARSKTIARS